MISRKQGIVVAAEMPKYVKIRTKDEKVVDVELEVARMFANIKELSQIGSNTDVQTASSLKDNTIEINNVREVALKKIIEWADHHKDDPDDDHDYSDPNQLEVPEWDHEFVSELQQSDMLELLQASNILGVRFLFEICCKTVADGLRGKTVEELRRTFSVGITEERLKKRKYERKRIPPKHSKYERERY